MSKRVLLLVLLASIVAWVALQRFQEQPDALDKKAQTSVQPADKGPELAQSKVNDAQQPAKMARVGYQSAGSSGEREEAFRQALRDLGYVEGKNLVVEWRFADGNIDRIPGNAAELVRLGVDVIVTGGSADTYAAREATTTIPIVMTNEGDPVGTGFVTSLARPGRNVTGLTSLSSELIGKRLELLKEIVPQLSRVFIHRGAGIPISAESLEHARASARSLGLELQFEDSLEPRNIDRAFDAIEKARPGALAVIAGPFNKAERKRLVQFATKSRLPAIYYRREFVEEGGLMSYHANASDLSRRAAVYVDKILKGAKPENLPVEQPGTFDLFINVRAAKDIGLTIPGSVLTKADKIIN